MAEATSWLRRLRGGLRKSSTKLADGIRGIFTDRKLDAAKLEELEELLIGADLGVGTAAALVAELKAVSRPEDAGPDPIRERLAEAIERLLEPVARTLVLDTDKKPFVVLVVGVNGGGKTTTIGKLAKQFRDAGKTVLLAAGDTFRAAAVAQLEHWGKRAGVPVLSKEEGADASGLAYDALERAAREKFDVLLIDTAGRLQNKIALMAELQKMVRALKKRDPEAPHATLLVLDANVGQNAHSQVETFRDMVAVDGLIVTKLDGTARGGVVVALAQRFGLPVYAVGVGEAVEDLHPFEAKSFARNLLGL
ncbi:MAG: signal recognition particle-docking protein FtsY [Pseudomonadota bacterium]